MGQHIAIVSALHAELAEVLTLMPDEHKRTVGGRTFWRGHLHGHEVVATLSGMGKVAAATSPLASGSWAGAVWANAPGARARAATPRLCRQRFFRFRIGCAPSVRVAVQ